MKTLYLLPLYFKSFSLSGQTWQQLEAARNLHATFIQQIKGEMDWDSILITNDTSIIGTYVSDIQQTIELLKSPMENEVDSFFHAICSTWYSTFPYRVSAHLQEELFIEDTSYLNRRREKVYGKNLYPKVSQIINLPSNKSIPLLIEYLDNHAATRLVVAPNWDFEDPSFYLSVSDMALELIKIITWCDFYDKETSYERLFSNLPLEYQERNTSTIRNWYEKTLGLPKNKAAAFFLDSICQDDYAISYTCSNLLCHGDTLTALRTYQTYYEKMDMPCRVDHEVGNILLSLGDRRVLEDCAYNIMNYRCSAYSGSRCVSVLLDSNYPYVDKILGEVVATEPHSLYHNKISGLVWPTILAGIGNYEKNKMPVTLVALMQIEDDLESIGDLYIIPWNKKYGNQIREGFRVCDLALLKYNDTIKPVNIKDWSDKTERDNAILSVIKESTVK